MPDHLLVDVDLDLALHDLVPHVDLDVDDHLDHLHDHHHAGRPADVHHLPAADEHHDTVPDHDVHHDGRPRSVDHLTPDDRRTDHHRGTDDLDLRSGRAGPG